jgi:hypothetical protein
LLLGLYFDLDYFVYALTGMLFLESITNYFVPDIFCLLVNTIVLEGAKLEYTKDACNPDYKINMESERVWRFTVGILIVISFYFHQQLWFLPWFMGLAILGAGISGMCPMILALRFIGFK